MKVFRSASLILITFSVLLNIHCAESEEEMLLRLKTAIDSGNKKEALQEINHILVDMNEDFSETIRSSSMVRKIANNRSGNMTAWIEGDSVYFFNGNLDSVNLDEYGSDLQISENARFGLVHASMEEQCILFPFSLETGDVFPELPMEKCEGKAAITGNGEVWYPLGKKIYRKKDPHAEILPSEPVLEEKQFSIKYSKIKNDFYIYSISENTLIIFYGNAGYYNLYRYAIDTDKLTLISSKPVKPFLYWTQKKDIFYPEEDWNSETDHIAWIFTGSAGNYTLSPLSKNYTLGSPLSNPPLKNFIPMADTGEFYIIDKNSFIGKFNSIKNSQFIFPVRAEAIMMFREGFLYNDENQSLKYRSIPFSDFEKKLNDLKKKAEEI